MVEDVETFVRASCGRFLARTLCEPSRAGIAEEFLELDGEESIAGTLCAGGACWRGFVDEVDLRCGADSPIDRWESTIQELGREAVMVFTDGSMSEEEIVEGGWYGENLGTSQSASLRRCGMARLPEYVSLWSLSLLVMCWSWLTRVPP